MEMDLANVVSSLQRCKHGFGPPPAAAAAAATTAIAPTEGRAGRVEDDVMEVALTLSMLGGSGRATPSSVGSGGGGMIPRVR
jgi:phage-related minor tail protein